MIKVKMFEHISLYMLEEDINKFISMLPYSNNDNINVSLSVHGNVSIKYYAVITYI